MITKPKGTNDIYGENAKKIKYLENIFNNLMPTYNIGYVRTPIFESSELYHRGVGETTDIVSKETYDFKDRADRNMTLRPEGTAGLVRAVIENKIYAEVIQPQKFWYFGPVFRYERPQAGRYREIYQFGVEMLGSYSPTLDVESISVAVNLLKQFNLKGIKVNINSLGDTETRALYKEALQKHFKNEIENMCEDCQKRYIKNPLRILDCKVDQNKEIMKSAPNLQDYFNEDSKKHFDEVLIHLNNLGIDYTINKSLVRGLDYYTHTVFEIEASIEGFGSQNVICGGGRYNNLVESLGGPSYPAVGFAFGVERLIKALEFENYDFNFDNEIDVYVAGLDQMGVFEAIKVTNKLRTSGFSVEQDLNNRNLKNNFKNADRLNAKYIIIIGEDEIKNKQLTIKNNKTKEEYKIKEEHLISFFKDDQRKYIKNDEV